MSFRYSADEEFVVGCDIFLLEKKIDVFYNDEFIGQLVSYATNDKMIFESDHKLMQYFVQDLSGYESVEEFEEGVTCFIDWTNNLYNKN